MDLRLPLEARPELAGPGVDSGVGRAPGCCDRARRAAAGGGSRNSRRRPSRSRTGSRGRPAPGAASSSSPTGTSMTPASTSGTKHRPSTAPARATSWASRGASQRPRQHGVLDRVGDGRGADGIGVDRAGRADRRDELLDVQGQAVRSLVHRSRDVLRRRQAGGQQQRRHRRGLIGRQALQLDLGRQALGEQPRAPIAERRPGWRLVESGKRPRSGPACRRRGGPAPRSPRDSGRPPTGGPRRPSRVGRSMTARIRSTMSTTSVRLYIPPSRVAPANSSSSAFAEVDAAGVEPHRPDHVQQERRRGCRDPAARGRPAASRTRAPGRVARSNARSASCRSRPHRRRAGYRPRPAARVRRGGPSASSSSVVAADEDRAQDRLECGRHGRECRSSPSGRHRSFDR